MQNTYGECRDPAMDDREAGKTYGRDGLMTYPATRSVATRYKRWRAELPQRLRDQPYQPTGTAHGIGMAALWILLLFGHAITQWLTGV